MRAVIFDLDGVLCDCREWHRRALNRALGRFDLPPIPEGEHAGRFCGLPTRKKLEVLVAEGRVPGDLVEPVWSAKQEYTTDTVRELCRPDFSIQDVFRELRLRGKKVGVATNAVRKTAELILRLVGVYPAVDSLITNESVANPKPAPDAYQTCALALRVDTSDCLAVEDGHYGVESARRAGCRVLRVSGPRDVTVGAIFKAWEEKSAQHHHADGR